MPTYTHPHHAGHRCLATGVLAVAAMQGMVAAVPWHDAHAESDAHADTVTATDTRVHVDESGAAVPGQRPQIKVLGTVDLLLVETTPIVIEGRLYRFESVRPEYWNNTMSKDINGPSYFRFVDVATGEHTPSFATNHAMGCALYDADTKTVYAYGTTTTNTGGGGTVDVFWSTDGMQTWQSKQAVDFAKLKKKVFNTSVSKGKLNGTSVYVMAYETSIAGTPGSWNTAFATAPTAQGPWAVLDDSIYRMALDVEHADPALRYLEEDG